MKETNLTISLQDLVASGCLSKCALSLHGEDGVCGGLSQRENLPLVNAARLSVLIARTFARLGAESCDTVAALHPSSVTLDDFAVSLALANGVDDATAAETLDPTEEDVGDLAPLRENELLDDSDNVWTLFSDFMLEEEDAGQGDRIVPGGSSTRAGEICAKSNMGRLSRSHSVGTTDTIVTPEPHSPSPPARDNEHSENRSLSPDREIFDIVRNAADECGSDTSWTLLGVELSDSGRFSAETKRLSASWDIDSPEGIQSLGKLIYEIMISSKRTHSHNDSLPEALKGLVLEEVIAGNNFNCNDIDINSVQRNSKMQRFRDRSMFNEFIDIGFPVAIARLLSDMIDIGKLGRSDSPFTSLADVIKDLRQMATHPHLYLDDPREDFSASALQFGKRCYGRGDEVASILQIASNLEDEHQESEVAEAIFVRGKSGSGKTHLCQSVGDFLTGQGWVVLNARFERGMEHESRAVVLSLFDKLVSSLVSMRDGAVDADVDYGYRATKAISDAFDQDGMAALAEFLPRMKELMGDLKKNNLNAADCMDNSIWQLVFLLSTLLAAVLSLNGPRILVHVDDLQWSDATMLKLMFEIVVCIGRLPHARERFLFVGMSRSDEKSTSHHHTTQYDSLSESKHVNVTSIDLGGLTSDDLVEMAMTEMRLPERLVRDLTCIIHKKTAGHALFAVQLLDTLVRDSVVVYSPVKHRYDWDDAKINTLQMLNSVASLIASNISSLPAAAQQSLRILSTLGMKSSMSIIDHLKGCSMVKGGNDIALSLPILIDAGIVESDGSSVVFCHDILHQAVYDGMSGAEQKSLHFDLGLCLGADTQLDDSNHSTEPCKGNKEYDSDVDPFAIQSTTITIATDQINHAGPEFVVEHAQRVRFSRWNLFTARRERERNENFLAALHYYNKGISFLDQQWLKDNQEHCLSLYKGASEALLACGKFEQVPQLANIIIENVSFENSIEAQCLLIKSLEGADKNQDAMATALELLPKLGFCLPGSPRMYFSYLLGYSIGTTPSVIKQRMKRISHISRNVDKVISSGRSQVDPTQEMVCHILDLIMIASRLLRSPYFPLIVCENTSYILKQQCLCVESIPSICNYSTLLIWLEDNYTEARKWALRAQKIMENAQHNRLIRTHIALYGVALAWFIPLKESAQHLFKAYELGMKVGDVSTSMIALSFHLRYLLHDGTELYTLEKLYDKYLPEMAKYNKTVAKFALSEMLYLNFLTGRPSNPFLIFQGMIPDENSLIVECQSKKKYAALRGLYMARFFRHYSNGDYDEAEKSSMLVQSLPNSDIPYISSIHYDFTRCLLAHKMYRDGKGDKYFDKGNVMLEKMKIYAKHSEQICKNKLLLLSAESHASMCEVEKAKESYDASIQYATIHGNIHDLAEAYELKGKYLLSIVDPSGSTTCFKRAYAYYMKWGAVYLAEKLQRDFNFDVDQDSHDVGVSKRSRDW